MPPTAKPRVFTAAQLATALGVTPQAVRSRLAGMWPARSGTVEVRGQEAAAFAFDELPGGLMSDLTKAWEATERRGWRYRNLAHFLSDPPPPAKGGPLAKADSPAFRAGDFHAIDAAIATIRPGTKPTPAEASMVWDKAFQTVEAFIESGKPEPKARRIVLRHLAETLPEFRLSRRSFDRKLGDWRRSGGALADLVDRRPAANRRRRIQTPPEDLDWLVVTALNNHAGELAPAWRQCREAGVLSPETAGRYTANPADLSYVPAAIRRLAGPEASTLADHFHRPRYAKLNGAHAIRDWREVGAGDWFSSDDFTLEVYFYIPDGQGWWKLTRGQWLPLVDCRSKKILDFILIPEKHYTAGNIRTVINHGCSRWGLPRRGFHFECGTWKQASLLGGPVPFGDVETTFAERLGVRIIHARPGNARAKIVENVGKLFQGRLRGEQGWCGPNEQVFKREELQRAARDVAARRMAPWEAGFLSFEQWFKRLEEHAAAYNQAPQASRVMGGNREVTMSPDEAWETLQSRDDGGAVIPVVKLPDDLRYLLVMHAQKVTVRAKGGIRCLNRTYANAETARLAGREVTVYLDHERPEHVQVVLDGDHVLTVPRVPSVPAFDASPEHFKSVADTAGAHNRGLSARVSELKARFMPPTRRVYADQASVAQGRVMAEQSRAFKEAERSAGHKDARLKALSRSTGMPILEDAPDLERGLTEMNKFLSHVD